MTQPPPRKGAYTKFVQNLHKEQFSKLQAKNQQELDLLDDIRNFMKQKAAIEKHYAEGLLKLSNVYGTKKIAAIEDSRLEGQAASPGDHNIYVVWKKLLEENEKIAKARLAAVQVFQEHISDEAKTLRSGKNSNAKRALDRLQVVQKDVQLSVTEVDRTKRIYFTEESDAIDVASKAQDAELKAKGKKRDVISIFQSKTSLKSKAGKLSARQEESDIKSTGARNDYLLSLETANAHQDRYFHYDLQGTIQDMEGGLYEKMSEYLGTLARTELLTCSALQNSFTKIKDQAEGITREYNYRCYLKAYTCLGDHVQYAFEAVEGDTVCTITPSEHDGGYSLNYEARHTAGKLNQSVKTIRAFRKRIKACLTHKSNGLKQEPNDPNGPNLDDKIVELENAIRTAETDKSKCEARLNKLREGGVSVDEYLDNINLGTGDGDTKQAVQPQKSEEWPTSNEWDTQEVVEEEKINYETSTNEDNGGWADGGEWGGVAAQAAAQAAGKEEQNEEADWAGEEQGNNQQAEQTETNKWNGQTSQESWGKQASKEQPKAEPDIVIDPNADIWKAVVLFNFDAQNEDELTVIENEEVEILVKHCDEEGWVMVQNSVGTKGYVPTNYVEVYASVITQEPQQKAAYNRTNSTSSAGQVVKQLSVESTASWGVPAVSAMPTIPETGPQMLENSSSEEEDESEEEDFPPGFGPPPGLPPTISIQDSDNEPSKRNARPISIQFGSSLDSDYCKGLYDYDANGSDELSFKEDDVIHIISRSPNGMDDGWWMGELGGKKGIFPSIVVEECQANGDDWSPDVSLASPTHSIAPPCFTPPGMDAPPAMPPPPPAPFPEDEPSEEPPQLPPQPPPQLPPQIAPSQPSLPEVPASIPCVPQVTEPTPDEIEPQPFCPPTEKPPKTKTSILDAPTTQITITNPTPLVEHEEDVQDEKPVSYHVEDSSFSMKMSTEKKEKYQNAVPVEVNVVEVDPQEVQRKPEIDIQKTKVDPLPILFNTEITVTAPTPRVLSPTEPLFACTSASESESESAVVQDETPSWANFDNAAEPAKEESQGWATFADSANEEVTDFPQSEKIETKTKVEEPVQPVTKAPPVKQEPPKIPNMPPSKPEPPKVNMPDIVPTTTIIEKPTQAAANVDDSEDSDLDNEEIINTNLQTATVGTVHAPSSSDTDSDNEPESDHKHRDSDSSDTESASGPEDTSTEMPPPEPKKAEVPLPPENLEPKQLKKLETMKESPA